MMTSKFRQCARALLALLCLCAPAFAQTSPADSSAPAPAAPPAIVPAAQAKTTKELVTRASQYFQLGEYDKAIVDYQAAYAQRTLPTLLFNIAQAHRKAGHWQEAQAYYERFLKDDPKSQLAPEADAQLAFVKAKLDAEKLSSEREVLERLAQRRAEEADALARVRESERKQAEAALLLATGKEKPIYKKPWFWVLIGGVVVAGAVAIAVPLVLRGHDPDSDLGLRVVQF